MTDGFPLWRKLRSHPYLLPRDGLLVLVPALGWWLAFGSRGTLMIPRCTQSPQTCLKENIFAMDQFVVGLANRQADALSFVTQDLSAVFAILLPLGWIAFRQWRRRLEKPFARTYGTDFIILLESILWNGFLNEATRLIVQRPRPFVYLDPNFLGNLPAHYTSFYSGHTSFSATVGGFAFFTLAGRDAPDWLLTVMGLTASTLVVLTGVFRVWAGRHFATDVLVGALAGSLTALGIALLHRPPLVSAAS